MQKHIITRQSQFNNHIKNKVRNTVNFIIFCEIYSLTICHCTTCVTRESFQISVIPAPIADGVLFNSIIGRDNARNFAFIQSLHRL